MTLNPVLRIGTQMVETLRAHEKLPHEEAWRRARDMLGRVGIASAEERMMGYPHQFSGGMRQRVAIAIALLHRPEVIIADEPTTALDVTIQAQILYEMQQLCRESRTALLWITHDLAIVAGLADEVCIMYAGKIVEQGPTDAVLDRPLHPYTKGLLASLPSSNQSGKPLGQIPGMMPALLDLPAGCGFQSRCMRATVACKAPIAMERVAEGRMVRCVHPCRDAAP
jgi:peptide/nickel transport system ATP-binding protein